MFLARSPSLLGALTGVGLATRDGRLRAALTDLTGGGSERVLIDLTGWLEAP